MPAGNKVKVVRSSSAACRAVCRKAAKQAGRTVVALAERIAEAAGAGCIAAEQTGRTVVALADRTVVALAACTVAVPAERIAEAAGADRRLQPEEHQKPSADGS